MQSSKSIFFSLISYRLNIRFEFSHDSQNCAIIFYILQKKKKKKFALPHIFQFIVALEVSQNSLIRKMKKKKKRKIIKVNDYHRSQSMLKAKKLREQRKNRL